MSRVSRRAFMQAAAMSAPAIETFAAQTDDRDTEFLDLHREVSDLEARLEEYPPEAGNRTYIRLRERDGVLTENMVTAPPHSIGTKVWELKYEKIDKFASRYDLIFDRYLSQIFTFGDTLVIYDGQWTSSGRGDSRFVIFNEFFAIDAKNHDNFGIQRNEDYHYSYQFLRLVPSDDSGFRIAMDPEVIDGFIPIFEKVDFYGVQRMISALSSEREKADEYKERTGRSLGIRSNFAYLQLSNIGVMLLKMMEDDPEMANAPSPKDYLQIPTPRVALNGNILISGRSIGLASRYDRETRSGNISLSIFPNGRVNYSYQPFFSTLGLDNPSFNNPIRKRLSIQFPDSR